MTSSGLEPATFQLVTNKIILIIIIIITTETEIVGGVTGQIDLVALHWVYAQKIRVLDKSKDIVKHIIRGKPRFIRPLYSVIQ
jgi:hypothetical protein